MLDPEKVVDDPPTYVLARKGTREVRRIDAHYQHGMDRWGNTRKRVRTQCVLFDTRTGDSRLLFSGSFAPCHFYDSAHQISQWLGIRWEEALFVNKDHLINF